ncbi:MAG: alpha/beta fold hydrolase [Methylococcus sp.]|nr:MAG: alpha/beta fold hydrolase [Methylococcus sp.]
MIHRTTKHPLGLRTLCAAILQKNGLHVALIAAAFGLTGCAPPIGVTKVSPDKAYELATRNPLSGDDNSDGALTVLQRFDLTDLYKKDPRAALHQLHLNALKDDRRDILFALAELNFSWAKTLPLTAERNSGLPAAGDAYLQSAVYAYLYLLGEGKESLPSAYDNRFREACELYNRSLDQAFRSTVDDSLVFSDQTRVLPEFRLAIDVKTDDLHWKFEEFEHLVPADAFDVFGFTSHNRTAGLGTPILGVTRTSSKAPNGGVLPITAFLQINGNLNAVSQGKAKGTLDLISSYDDVDVVVNGRTVPLQTDSTTPLAYRLNDKALWNIGLKRFIFGEEIEKNILFIQAYQPGRIPVVLVHGTGGSPVWWAEMVNTLRADPLIRMKYQFWFYEYSSSRPVPASAADLRDTLTNMVHQLDPQHQDPAMQQMVVIGHSQGGLLTHMTAIDSGDALWKAISDKPFKEFTADPMIKEGFRRALFFNHLPFVKRVVFISTPHRGSFLTEDWVRKLTRQVVGSPMKFITNMSSKWREVSAQLNLPEDLKDEAPTAVDGMSVKSPVMSKVAGLPLAPGITGHSIIPVLPGMDIKSGNDGVVEYKSAHIEGVESEFVVRTHHGAQGNPIAIDEVRRILHKHCDGLPNLCGTEASNGITP